MPSDNGTVLRLGDLTARTLPIEIERNEQAVILRGYVDGNRCPVHVKAEISAARRVWVEATKAGTDEYAYDDTAWRIFLRDVLLAAVRGLEFGEAEVLASDDDLSNTVLVTLGWFKAPEAVPDPEATTAKPDQEPSPTTPSSVADSASSTASPSAS
jgi:hypothetical protein